MNVEPQQQVPGIPRKSADSGVLLVLLWGCSKSHVNSDPLLDFIKETVASAPDLPPPGADEPLSPKPKRQRWAAPLACLTPVWKRASEVLGQLLQACLPAAISLLTLAKGCRNKAI